MLTKKDFEKIAEIFKKNNPDPKNYDFNEQTLLQSNTYFLEKIILDFCKLFKEQNSRFDKEKFLKACGDLMIW